MATHNDVLAHLDKTYAGLHADASVIQGHMNTVEHVIEDNDSWKVTARQAIIVSIKAVHTCSERPCPLDDWQDELSPPENGL